MSWATSAGWRKSLLMTKADTRSRSVTAATVVSSGTSPNGSTTWSG